jgi:hypothetical protein
MPEISRFLGIVIYMYFNDHNPPHFHVHYEKYRAIIDIKTLGITDGKLPSKVSSLVVEWGALHKKELMKNWQNIKKTGEFSRIKPLC